MRRDRNCDGFTNPILHRPGVGIIKTCPNALPLRSYAAFRWWLEYNEHGRLPFAGYDFAGQPHQVCQAIRIGEEEYRMARAQPAAEPAPKLNSMMELAVLMQAKAKAAGVN